MARAAVALLALSLSCSSSTEPGADAAAIQVLPASVRMSAGDTLSLAVAAFDAQGRLLAGARVSYQSNSVSVVTVSDAGLLRAIGLGTATITVSVGTQTASVPVVVVGAPWAVQVSPARVRLLADDSLAVSASVVDAAGTVLSGLSVTFTTGNSAVAGVTTVGSTGGATLAMVRAVTAGVTTLQAASGILQTPVPVVVYAMQVAPSPFVVEKDSTAQLTVTVRDSTGALVPSPALTFRSSDTTVATVSATGVVRGVKTGITSIAISYAGLTRNVDAQVPGNHPAGVLDQTVTLGLRPYGVAVSPSGLVYVTQLDGGTVSVGQLPTLAFGGTVAVGSVPTDVVFNSTGTTAWVANQFDGNIGVIDVASGRQVGTITLPAGTPFRVLVSPDDRTLYVSTNSTGVLAYDATTRALKAHYAISDAINGLALHPAGGLLYATGYLNGLLYEINLNTGVIRAATVGGAPQDVVISPDGATLYVANMSGALQLRSAATGALVATVPSATGGFSLQLSADGLALWVGSYGASSIQIVNTATLAVQTIATGVVPRRIRFDATGKRAVVANEGGTVMVFK